MASVYGKGPVFRCDKVDELNKHIQNGVNTNKLVVVTFTATRCPLCRYMVPFYFEIATRMPHVLFLKVIVDEMQSAEKDWNVKTTPTYVFIKGGEEVDRFVGPKREELEQITQKHA